MPFRAHDAATDLIDRARSLLEASSPSRTTGISAAVREDIRRLSIIMAVAALDTFMHRLIVERAYEHRSGLPGALARLGLPFEQLLDWADESAAAARKPKHNSRPRVAVKKQLRQRLLRETFQAYDDVSKALGMIGQSRKWDLIGDRLTSPLSPSEIKIRLNEIVERRNRVVHEGDYERLERPQTAKLNPVTYREAKADIDFIADLIDAIHAVVSSPAASRRAESTPTAAVTAARGRSASAAPRSVEQLSILSDDETP